MCQELEISKKFTKVCIFKSCFQVYSDLLKWSDYQTQDILTKFFPITPQTGV